MDLSLWQDAQRAVVGSLLIDPDKVSGLVFSRARAEHFSDPALRHVFEAARGIWQERRPVDAVTVAAAAGPDYRELIADAMRATPTAANVESYLALIRDAAKLRAIQTAAMAIASSDDLEQAAAAYWEGVHERARKK